MRHEWELENGNRAAVFGLPDGYLAMEQIQPDGIFAVDETTAAPELMAELLRLAEENAMLRGFNATAESAQLLGDLVHRLVKHAPVKGSGTFEFEAAREQALAMLREG